MSEDEDKVLGQQRRLGRRVPSKAGKVLLPRLHAANVATSKPKLKGRGLDSKKIVEVDLGSLAVAMQNDRALRSAVAEFAPVGVFPAINGLKKWAEDTLGKAGLPTSDALVILKEDGTWRLSEGEADESAGRRTIGLELAFKEEGSSEYAAGDILRTMHDLCQSYNWIANICPDVRERLDGLLSQAFKLGELRGHNRWKIQHEPFAIDGYRSADHLRQRREAAAIAKRNSTVEKTKMVIAAHNDLLEQKPEFRQKRQQLAAAKRIAETNPHLDLSPETIRKILRRNRNQKK